MAEPVHEFTSATSTTTLYACGNCRLLTHGHTTSRDDDAAKSLAIACCTCPSCGTPVKGPGRSTCDSCRQKNLEARLAAERAKAFAIPPSEDKGEPVWVKERFYRSADEAAEAIWDDGGDPTVELAHPCTVARVDTPCLSDHVLESWSENFDDPDEIDIAFRKETAALLEGVQARIEAEAPECWIPRTNERIVLPAIEVTEEVGRG